MGIGRQVGGMAKLPRASTFSADESNEGTSRAEHRRRNGLVGLGKNDSALAVNPRRLGPLDECVRRTGENGDLRCRDRALWT